jgi:HEAT repeat protein
LLDEGGEPAVYAVWALGEIGDDRAITPLTKLLKSGDARLRSGAEEALRKFG